MRRKSLALTKRTASSLPVPPKRTGSRIALSLLVASTAAATVLALHAIDLLHAPCAAATFVDRAETIAAYEAAAAAERRGKLLSQQQQPASAQDRSARVAAAPQQRLRAPAHPTWAALPNAAGRAPTKSAMVEYSRNVLVSSFCGHIGAITQCQHFVETPGAPFCTDVVWAKRWCAAETFDSTEPKKQSDRDGPRLARACADHLPGKDCAFFSQQLEDKEMWDDYFQNTADDGVYVELGALNGQLYSNTKFFEETLGWGGVLIEPSTAFATLRRGRSGAKRDNALFNVAVCKEAGEVEFADGGVFTGAQSWVASIPGTVVSPGSCASLSSSPRELCAPRLASFSHPSLLTRAAHTHFENAQTRREK